MGLLKLTVSNSIRMFVAVTGSARCMVNVEFRSFISICISFTFYQIAQLFLISARSMPEALFTYRLIPLTALNPLASRSTAEKCFML